MPSLRLLRSVVLRVLRTGVLLMLAWACVPAGAAPAQGAQTDAFTVRGVEVDVTAANPQAAKDQALAEGQRQAFRLLLERLTQPADHARLPKADGTQYIRDFSVDHERSSATRYLATLSVRFSPAAVKRLLQNANIAYAEPRSKAVVIVPVFKAAGAARPVLWDEPNPWRAAWVSLGGGGLVPLVVPAGDLGDIQAISVEQALAGNLDAMEALGVRWRSSDVLVIAAGVTPSGKGIDVAMQGTPDTPKPFETLAYEQAEGESLEAMLFRAARDIGRAIDTVHKQPNLLQFDRAGSISTLVPLQGIEDWLAVRERLGRVSQVRRWELVSLSRSEAALVLHIVGDQEAVKGALANAGLKLEWSDGFWTMRPPGARR